MSDQTERNQFIDKLRNSVPSHTEDSDDIDGLMEPFKNVETISYSSLILNLNIVIDAAITFAYKYAGYTPGSLMEKGDMFFSSDPILTYSKNLESMDRALVWANGIIVYNHDPMNITLILDKKVVDIIENE